MRVMSNFPEDVDYLELTEQTAIELAIARGVRYRITRRDDKSFISTLDYDAGRVNFQIRRGVIDDVSRG